MHPLTVMMTCALAKLLNVKCSCYRNGVGVGGGGHGPLQRGGCHVSGGHMVLKQQSSSGVLTCCAGPLPPSWGALTKLRDLRLGVSKLRGPLPPEWSTMVALEILYVGQCELTGEHTCGVAGHVRRVGTSTHSCFNLSMSGHSIYIPSGMRLFYNDQTEVAWQLLCLTRHG